MGVRRCLARSLTSLALRCALQRVQTVPAAIHSGRIPPPRQPPTGTEDSASPLTTPDMVRSGRVLQTSVKSNLYSKLDDFPVVGYEKPSVVKLFSFTCIELLRPEMFFLSSVCQRIRKEYGDARQAHRPLSLCCDAFHRD